MLPEFRFSFVDGPKVEIPNNGTGARKFHVKFIDARDNTILFQDTIPLGHFTKCNHQYYVPWLIQISENGQLVKEYLFKPHGRIVIQVDSSALGDTLCWVPYIEEFRKKWDCEVWATTFHNHVVQNEYPEIHWFRRNQKIENVTARYRIGWFGTGQKSIRNPIDCRTIPLQKVGASILGFDADFREIRTKVTRDARPPIIKLENYIVLSTSSTAQAKYWNNPRGWQEVINWLDAHGYKVVHVGRDKSNLKRVIDMTGMKPINDIINIIQNCSFFMGISSGLSWLSWGLGKRVVMVSGFTPEWHEFQEDNIRIINKNVCNSCMSNTAFTFNRADWNWCPVNKGTHRQFECSKTITEKDVIQKLQQILISKMAEQLD